MNELVHIACLACIFTLAGFSCVCELLHKRASVGGFLYIPSACAVAIDTRGDVHEAYSFNPHDFSGERFR